MIHRVLGAFVTAVMGAAMPGGAQEPEDPGTSAGKDAGPELTEEIFVTGSRVKRKDLTTPAPVTVVSRDEIAASGRTTIGEFLLQLPEQGNGLSRQMNNGGDGSTRVSLRSLGDYRTLVLLNGRRYVTTGVGADRSVDLNTIPTSAVERVEVLKDGASPIYGSDAMGGVINIITRKRWSGVEASAYGGLSSRGDAAARSASFTVGSSADGGSYLLTGSYTDLGAAMADDRPFSAEPHWFDFATGTKITNGSPVVPQGTIILPTREVGVQNGNALWNQLVSTYPTERRFIRDPTAANGLGWRPMGMDGLAGAGGDLYNYAPENYVVTPLRLMSMFATGDRRVGEASRIFFEASYVNRRSDQMLAPLPLQTRVEGIVVSADNIYNPFGRDFTAVNRRIVETDRRRIAQDVDTFRILGGVDGALPSVLGPLAGGSWDVSANFGRSRATQSVSGWFTLRGVAAALGPSFVDPGPNGVIDTPLHGALRSDDVGVCGTPTNPIRDCVPLDFFNGPGSITPGMLDQLTYSGTYTGTNELLSLQANASAPLFRLGADRPVGFATGYEYRRIFGELVPDTMSLRGDRRDLRQGVTRGTSDVHEVYAELSIPVLSGLVLAREVELMAAARAFKHQRFDPDWTWKIGARWKPIQDLTLRGTASTSYRVPSIAEMYLGEFLGDGMFVPDPCADLTIDPVLNPGMTAERAAWCRAAGVPSAGTADTSAVPAPLAGNPALRPETARVFTAGVVLEPRFARNLSVTVDYWDVRVSRGIGQPNPGMILDLCYPDSAGATPRLCDLVHRDPATGRLLQVTDRVLNSSGAETAAGIDAGARYQLPTRIGRFGAALDVTWLDHHDVENFDGRILHGKGTYDLYFLPNALTALNPEWKYVAGLTWGLGGLSTGATVRYFSGFKECGGTDAVSDKTGIAPCSFTLPQESAQYSRRVASWTSLDLLAEYQFGTRAGRTTLAVGVHNALDAAPPFTTSSYTPYGDASGYDFIGRFFYTRLSQRF